MILNQFFCHCFFFFANGHRSNSICVIMTVPFFLFLRKIKWSYTLSQFQIDYLNPKIYKIIKVKKIEIGCPMNFNKNQ